MGIGGIGIWQLLIILVIVLLLFGTKKLRNLGGDLGGAIKGFKKAVNGEKGETAETADADAADAADATEKAPGEIASDGGEAAREPVAGAAKSAATAAKEQGDHKPS